MEKGPSVAALAREFLEECEAAWWGGGSSLPDLGRTYTRREQQERGRELVRMTDQALAELRHPPVTNADREAAEERMTASGRAFARSTFGVSDAHVDLLLRSGFTACAQEFARRARAFDPEMPIEDIAQASRNVWTMNALQTMLGLPLRVTPSAFGYSMLYPFTDNLLDDPSVTEEEKALLNERFGRRIRGEPLAPHSGREQALWSLFAEIESEHPRETALRVYDSLEVIQRAQTRSILLSRRDEPPYALDVLGISLEKGGASVLADGYLVAGDLRHDHASLFFALGAFLQLADDLQDVDGDAEAGTLTIFSQSARRWPLDRLVSRLFHFRAHVLAQLVPGSAPGAAELADLVRHASLQLILAAVGGAPDLFTRGYARTLESFSPFPLRTFARQRRRLEKKQGLFHGVALSALADPAA